MAITVIYLSKMVNSMEHWIKKFLKRDTICRSFSENWEGNPVCCGIIPKRNENYRGLDTDTYALVVLLQGRGTYIDSCDKEYPLNPGDAFQRIPGQKHSSLVDPDSDYWEGYLSVDRKFYRHMIEMGIIGTGAIITCKLTPGWLEQFKEYIGRLGMADYLDGARALLELYRLIYQLTDRKNGKTSKGMDARVIKAMELMRRECCSETPLNDIAAKCGIGLERFRKLFQEQTGVSPGQYRIRCRIDQARTILGKNEYSLQETASALGYPDVFSFSKQFKQQTGISPGKYRL